MDWNFRKNGKYLLLLAALCGLVPHGMLSLLQLASASEKWSPAEIEAYSHFFVCQWAPFWAALIAYLRLQKKDNFSLLPGIAFGLILLTFLPRFPQASVRIVALTIPFILAIELTALLKKMEASANKALAGIATDRRLLRAFFFWSVGFLCLTHISCEARMWDRVVASPFLMLPIPGVLLAAVFRQQDQHPPTVWGVVTMLAMVPASLLLAVLGSMAQFKLYHLMSLCTGYVTVFVMLIVYNLDRWKRPNCNFT